MTSTEDDERVKFVGKIDHVFHSLCGLKEKASERDVKNLIYWERKLAENLADDPFRELRDLTNAVLKDKSLLKEQTLSYLKKLQAGLSILDFSEKPEEFEVPREITDGTVRETLEEAIGDYRNGFFYSTAVMCRRAYEITLFLLYVNEEKKTPIIKISDGIKIPMTLGDLYVWFIHKYGESEVADLAGGILVKRLGDEAAHVPGTEQSSLMKKEAAKAALSEAILLIKSLFIEFPVLSQIEPDKDGKGEEE